MSSDYERIEGFLKGIVLPEYDSGGHERQLRAQILSRVQARRAGSGVASRWKIAALLLALLAGGALAAEIAVRLHHYYFYGKAKDGYYFFSTTPENAETDQGDSIGICVGGDLDAAGIEQRRKDLEEIDSLRQRNARELFRVYDTEKNGKPTGRIFIYKYVLSGGRTEMFPEGGDVSLSPAQMEADRQQIADLRQRDEREIWDVIEMAVGGQTQRIVDCRYILSDGRGVMRAEPDPELPGTVPLTFKQRMELDRLAVLEKKGKFLGSTQVQVLGKTVHLQKYRFTLSDGTVVIRSQGRPEDFEKNQLTPAESNEFQRLAEANKGETLGTYEENVLGKPFKFTRVKYVLSDGTEVLRSTGKPDGGR